MDRHPDRTAVLAGLRARWGAAAPRPATEVFGALATVPLPAPASPDPARPSLVPLPGGADRALDAVRSTPAHAGISLRPVTPIARLEPYLDRVSMVLVMSVEPGFGGQSFLPDSLARIRGLAKRIGKRPIEIAVDGGIHAGNVRDVVRAGADVIIAGSAVFGASDRLAAMRQLLEAAQ